MIRIVILVVAEKGYGKRSSLDEYRITNRGGKGVKTLNIRENRRLDFYQCSY
jgi:DNA gyrase/topoisomerase IV subunit A